MKNRRTNSPGNRFINIVGQTFGRLKVLKENGRRPGRVLWLCSCTCGGRVNVISTDLRTGHTQSCGCWNLDRISIHGHNGAADRSPTYRSWQSMIQRCTNPNATRYPVYGGAGVKVCERWKSFENFLSDMGPRPEGTTLGRFFDTGNYMLSNCKWMTFREQINEQIKKRGMICDNQTK